MNSEFQIRGFKDNDYNEVVELWLETDLSNPERNDTLETIHKTLKHDGAFFIMEQKATKKIVGTSWITNDGRRLYLHHFGIKPEFQGKKFSKQLLEVSLDFASKNGLQIKLEVHKENNIALNLYKKSGFDYLGDYEIYIIRNFNNRI